MNSKILALKKFDGFTEKGKLKIADICQKAAQVFSVKGFMSARLADISHAAGISKGGIYHYFATKEELLFVILSRYMDMLLRKQKEIMKTTATPHEKIRTFIRHHISHYADNLPESRLILHESRNLPPNYWNIIKDQQREYVNLLKSNVEILLKSHDMNSEKAKIFTYSLLGMCNWPYTWYNPKGPLSPENLAEEVYKIFIGHL